MKKKKDPIVGIIRGLKVQIFKNKRWTKRRYFSDNPIAIMRNYLIRDGYKPHEKDFGNMYLFAEQKIEGFIVEKKFKAVLAETIKI